MKRIILSFMFAVCCLIAGAQQIFSHITKLDKFDDVVWEKNLKTIITFNDSIITIETKGQDPEYYFCKDNSVLSFHSGTQESLVNLVDDIWGYEDVYYPELLIEAVKSGTALEHVKSRESIFYPYTLYI